MVRRSEPSRMGSVPLIKEIPQCSLPFLPCEDTGGRRLSVHQAAEPHRHPTSWCLDRGLSASRTDKLINFLKKEIHFYRLQATGLCYFCCSSLDRLRQHRPVPGTQQVINTCLLNKRMDRGMTVLELTWVPPGPWLQTGALHGPHSSSSLFLGPLPMQGESLVPGTTGALPSMAPRPPPGLAGCLT